MSRRLSRRRCLQSLAAAPWLLNRNRAIAVDPDAEWNFPLLGDLHFDRSDHHDLDWVRREHPGDERQIENYSRLTAETLPRLIAAVRQDITPETRCVVQVGDLIEGLCGTPELARRQAEEATSMITAADWNRPFYLTKGNHDVTGPGAREAYNECFVPFLTRQSEVEAAAAAFTRRHGGVLLAFYDAYDTHSLDWLSRVVEEQRPQRLIVVIHPPVVPYNARSSWHVYSDARQQAERTRLLDLLGRQRAVVLSGHLHKFSYLVRRTESGWFTQLALSSIATSADGAPQTLLEGRMHYSADLVSLDPQHSPETLATRREWLSAERPMITDFQYADSWGRAVVRIRGREVAADVYRGLDRSAWRTIDLTAPPT